MSEDCVAAYSGQIGHRFRDHTGRVSERSDAGFSLCTKVADLGQEFCAFLSQSESRSCGTTFSSS